MTHKVELNLDLLEPLGIPGPSDPRPRLRVPVSDAENARLFRESYIDKGELAVGLHPGGNMEFSRSRCWGVRHFAELAHLLIAKYNASVFIFCSEDDCFIAERIEGRVRNLGRIVVVRGRRLREVTAIVQQMDLFVGNNSSLMHVAAAVGVPTLGLFGSTDSTLTGPRGGDAWVVRLDLPCSPCFEITQSDRSRRCLNHNSLACLRHLKPDLVMKVIAEILLHRHQEKPDDPIGYPRVISLPHSAGNLESQWKSVGEEVFADLLGAA